MKKTVIVIGIVAVLGIGFYTTNKITTKIRLENAIEEFDESLKNGNILHAQEIYNDYSDNSSFTENATSMINESGKTEIQNFIVATTAEDCEKCKNSINELIKLGYNVAAEDRNSIKEEYNRLYNLCYQNDHNKVFAQQKIDMLSSIQIEGALSGDADFFEEQFNTIMSDLITGKINKEFAISAYSMLSPIYADNKAFAEGRVEQIYNSYNTGNIKYEAAVNIFEVLKSAGIATTKVSEKTTAIKNLWDSKTAYANGVKCMNVNDYINAFDNFNKVIAEDSCYTQKNTYVNEMLPKAKQAAFSKITAYCNSHDYDSARNVITTYDKYLNSAELRDKRKNIDEAEEAYKKAVERQSKINQVRNAIRIRKIKTSAPNSAGGVDLEIYWTNKSCKTIKYVSFYVQAYNAVNDPVSSEIGWSSRQGVRVTGPIAPYANYGENTYWDCVWYNNTIKYAKVMSIDITYMDGMQLHFDDDVASYATY